MKTVAIQADWSPMVVTIIKSLMDSNCVVIPLSPVEKDIYPKLSIAQAEYIYDMTENKFKPTGLRVDNKLLLDFHRPGFVLFSSGTTGPPKAVLHDFHIFMRRFSEPGKTFKTIMFLMFDHIGGWNTMFYTLQNGGQPIYLMDRSPEGVCRAIEEYQAELLPTTPTFLNMILFTQMYKKYFLGSLKVITYGTESMPQTTLEAIADILPDVKLKQTYGLSELGILATQSEKNDSLWVKVGGPGYQTKIVDSVLWVKSEMSMIGYLNAESPFDADGWYCTGDRVEEQVRWDTGKLQPIPTGYIRFLGRDTDIINVGGEKVYPAQVENCILEMNGIKEVAVSGIPNVLMGSTVFAKVYAEDSQNRDELKKRIMKHCRARLGKYKTPTKIEFVDNAMVTERWKRAR